jgi:biotin carboxylase
MRVLILGGSNIQLNAIKRTKALGIETVVCDYLKDSPGKKISDFSHMASTFDEESCLKAAKEYEVDGIFTLGTDQPVYTASYVAEKMGFKSYLDTKAAKAVTNKKVMKNIFKDKSIPTVSFAIIGKDFKDQEIAHLRFPVVVKPLDSQGQRGVFKLNHISQIREEFDNVICFSRENEILVEEYYKSDEITISGYVVEDKMSILTVTDRLTYEADKHIGICTAHHFPSKYMKSHFKEIEEISSQIVKAFAIHNGPIYFQMLIGKEGILVNEIACRIGGAYEDMFIPLITGIDILDYVIKSSLGMRIDYKNLDKYKLEDNRKFGAVLMIFAEKCRISCLNDMKEMNGIPGFYTGGYNFKVNDEIGDIENATARAGFMIVTGTDEVNLEKSIDNAYSRLKILDQNGENKIISYRSSK